MSDSVPPILWYLLAVIALAVFPLVMVATLHRQRMKVLEILRSYAEKGVEAPPGVAELLAKHVSEPEQKWKSTARGSRLNIFLGHLFVACLFGGIAWWRFDAGGPPWAVYLGVGSAIFFGVSALGFLVAALVSNDK
jgi:hypothetical protein